MNEDRTYHFTIDAEHAGLRADGVLSQLFEEYESWKKSQ